MDFKKCIVHGFDDQFQIGHFTSTSRAHMLCLNFILCENRQILGLNGILDVMFVLGVYTGFTSLFSPFIMGSLPLLFFVFGRIRTTSNGHRFKLIFLILLVLLLFQAFLVFPSEVINTPSRGEIYLMSIMLLLIFGTWYIIDLLRTLPILKNLFSIIGVLLSALWLFSFSVSSATLLLQMPDNLDTYATQTNTITIMGFCLGLTMPIVSILWFADRIYKRMILNPYWKRMQLLVGAVLIVVALRQLSNYFMLNNN